MEGKYVAPQDILTYEPGNLQNCQPDKQALSNSSQDYSLQRSELWNIAKLSQYQQEKLPKLSAYPRHPSNPWTILMSSSHSLCPSYRTRKLQHCLPAQTVGYHAGDCPLLFSSDKRIREIKIVNKNNQDHDYICHPWLVYLYSYIAPISMICWLDSLFINLIPWWAQYSQNILQKISDLVTASKDQISISKLELLKTSLSYYSI